MIAISPFFRLLLSAALVMGITSCGGGSGGTPAPGGLSYPSPAAFTVDVAIAALNPTVSGTATSFKVTPSLPPGLILNATTGVISGTPVTVTAKASYTVTASNAGGSASAAIAIAVNDVAPNVGYASSFYSFTAGVAAVPITPTATGGAIVTWSVAPGLPAGLIFDAGSGKISGTPSVGMAPTAYVVTATNSGGASSATLTLAVSSGPLLDVGHATTVSTMAFVGSSLLSADTSGHWALWNYSSGDLLASGNGPAPAAGAVSPPVALAGSTAVVQTATGLHVLTASSGTVEAEIAATLAWWTLAADGSYICGATPDGLMCWSPTGTVMLKLGGDYSNALAYAARGEVRVALSPAGQNVIQTIAVPAGTATVSPAFAGAFLSWFLDGARFFTAVGDDVNTPATVWVYSATGTQEEIIDNLPLSPVSGLAYLSGEGTWFWLYGQQNGAGVTDTLNIYAVGATTTPAASYSYPSGSFHASGTTLAAVNQSQATIVDLSGASPVSSSKPLPLTRVSAFAATSSSVWVAGNALGVLLDGPSLAGTPRYLDYGQVLSIAGSSSRFAIATASGRILDYDPVGNSLERTIDFPSPMLALSPDGKVLAAASSILDVPDQTLNVYAMPAGTLENTLTFGSNSLQTLELAGSGPGVMLGLVFASTPTPACYGEAILANATMPTWCNTSGGTAQVQISPDRTLIAAATAAGTVPVPTTTIFKNGVVSTAVSGEAMGWLDDGSLLVNTFTPPSGREPFSVYTGAAIFSAAGTQQSAVPLPQLYVIQVLTGNSIYSPRPHGIFSLPSGALTWTSASPLQDAGQPYAGAVSGSEVIFPSGNLVLAETMSAR